MPRAHVPAALLTGPFTTATARAHGVSTSALRSLPWRQLFRNVWVHCSLEDTRELRLAAVRLVMPPFAVLVGLTAAWVHGVDVRREDDLDVHVGYPKGRRARPQPGLIRCQETLDPLDIVVIDGVPVTSPVRTSFDCARWLRGVERIVVVDALANAQLATVADLRAYIAGKRRLRNLRIAERLLDQCDAGAESPMETRVRVLLVHHGLCPETQIEVYGHDKKLIGRLDMGFPDIKLAVEYDGAQHWRQRRADDRRRDQIREMGWEVLVYSADDYYQTPLTLVADVWRHVQQRRFGRTLAG